MKILLSILLIITSISGCSQTKNSDSLIYKDGKTKFDQLIFKTISSTDFVDSIRQVTYCNVNVKIDRKGQIQSVDIFSIGDSEFSKVIYKAIMLTSGKWSTSISDNRIFNILFVSRYETGNKDNEIPYRYYYDHFGDYQQNKITRYGVFPITKLPSFR